MTSIECVTLNFEKDMSQKHEENRPLAVSQLSDPTTSKDVSASQPQNLIDMGYILYEVNGWEDIEQPFKLPLNDQMKKVFEGRVTSHLTIYIDATPVKCHLLVLQCYSGLFMKSKFPADIYLSSKDITLNGFNMAYNWMLAENPQVRPKGIVELFGAATYLHIEPLLLQCWAYLENNDCFREEAAFMLFLETQQFELESMKQLQSLMLTRICKFFMTLVASKHFLDLTFEELCILITSNTICVNTEIEILLAVARWIAHDWNTRGPLIVDVLNCVRFGLMPPWHLGILNSCLTDSGIVDRIVRNPEVRNLVTDGMLCSTVNYQCSQMTNLNSLRQLEYFKIIEPVQRQWVFDTECQYHHHINCTFAQRIPYKSLIEYLEKKQALGANYRESLTVETGETTYQMQPCCDQYSKKYRVSAQSSSEQKTAPKSYSASFVNF